MIVVADTGPINYLLLIDEIDLLQKLYGRIILPREVHHELCDPCTPAIVRAWMETPPTWLEVYSLNPKQPLPAHLDAGEAAAIALAVELGADQIVMDDQEGRLEAERRGLLVVGTIGVLAQAHQSGHVDLRSALRKLERTNFRIRQHILASLLAKIEG